MPTASIRPSSTRLLAGNDRSDIGGQLAGFAHKPLQALCGDARVPGDEIHNPLLNFERYSNACGTAMIVPFMRTGWMVMAAEWR